MSADMTGQSQDDPPIFIIGFEYYWYDNRWWCLDRFTGSVFYLQDEEWRSWGKTQRPTILRDILLAVRQIWLHDILRAVRQIRLPRSWMMELRMAGLLAPILLAMMLSWEFTQ